MESPFGDRRLELSYPCSWCYKIIGRDEVLMRSAVAEIVGDAQHTLRFSNTSRTGKYKSLELELTVRDEEHRLGTFEALKNHSAVEFLL